jgi:hypothetical protein
MPSGNWSITTQAAYSGNNCLKVNNFGTIEGTKHFLESKTFDLSDSARAYFSFKYAFAKRDNSNNDYLKILASKDCGKTWAVRKMIQNSQLTTAPNHNFFIPTSTEWKEAMITSILGPYCVENFRFKFEFKSGGGNNLYIDDLNISFDSPTSILSKLSENFVEIYPNPSSNILNISSSNLCDEVYVYDVYGKLILFEKTEPKDNLVLDISELKKGLYTILVKSSVADKSLPFIKN